jgi:hypothetical protein
MDIGSAAQSRTRYFSHMEMPSSMYFYRVAGVRYDVRHDNTQQSGVRSAETHQADLIHRNRWRALARGSRG